jgi:ElaB/YqjD/DUF883 family membrane-anchored ribosome-binding protein
MEEACVSSVEQSAKPKDEASQQPARPVGEIQSDIEETRARLMGNIEQLKAEASPKALGGKAQAKVKAVFVNEDGSVKTERVAAVAGVVVGLLLLRRGAKARSRRKELQRLSQVVWVPVPRSAVNPEIAGLARNARELAPLAESYSPALALTSA